MWSPTKLDFPFYDFFCDLSRFFKDSIKINIKEKEKSAATLASNRSGRSRDRFQEFKKSGRTVSLFRRENGFRLKLKKAKGTFS